MMVQRSHYEPVAGLPSRPAAGDPFGSLALRAGLPSLEKHVLQHAQLEQSSRPKVSGQYNTAAEDHAPPANDSYVMFLRHRGWLRGVSSVPLLLDAEERGPVEPPPLPPPGYRLPLRAPAFPRRRGDVDGGKSVFQLIDEADGGVARPASTPARAAKRALAHEARATGVGALAEKRRQLSAKRWQKKFGWPHTPAQLERPSLLGQSFVAFAEGPVFDPPVPMSPLSGGASPGGKSLRSFPGDASVLSGATTGSMTSVVEQRRADEALRNATRSKRVAVADVLACLPSSKVPSDTLASREPNPGVLLRQSLPSYSLNTAVSLNRRENAMSIVPKKKPVKFRY